VPETVTRASPVAGPARDVDVGACGDLLDRVKIRLTAGTAWSVLREPAIEVDSPRRRGEAAQDEGLIAR